MNRRSSLSPYQQAGQPLRTVPGKPAQTAQGAAEFLRAHDRMAALLPTVARMAALKQDCASLLPDMFDSCEILHFDSALLTLSVPNAALAARLKHRLPKLQEALQMRGWQVSAIRLKVQVGQPAQARSVLPPLMQKKLPAQAVSALATLGQSLEDSPRNAALKAAIEKLVSRHQKDPS